MNVPNVCPQCGSELPTNAPGGICPKCLMQAGLQSREPAASQGPFAATTPPSAGFDPPPPDAIASYFPHLEIEELIGQGGMGAVYRARQKKLDREVALKIIRPESAQDNLFAERFNREARTLARLNHPNIVSVHDFGDVELTGSGNIHGHTHSLYYIIMEYVDGATLRQLMSAGELTSAHALSIVPQICEALQFAHDEGVIHRDIKPENILVDSRGQIKIADFGLAKLLSDDEQDYALTGTHQIMGTPRYMAPEQMEQTRAVDHRADIYSLGVVFYEMLTGDLPLGRFDPPSEKSSVDRQWDSIVMRALENEPKKRYQHASEVKWDLEQLSDADQKPVRSFAHKPAGNPPAFTAAAGSTTPTAPHYGMLMMGAVMAAVGFLLLAIGMAERGGFVFIWVGIGIAIGGGGCASGAFNDNKRLPRGAAPNYGMLIQGGIMIFIGLGLMLFCFAQNNGSMSFHVANPLVWVGIGIALGGGGCLSGAWNQDELSIRDTQHFKPHYSRKAIVGACWAPFFFLAAVLFLFFSDMPGGREVGVFRPTPRGIVAWTLVLTVLPLGLSAPFGTTILGLMSISNIRHSQDEVFGMPLAVTDALLFPLLLLDGVIITLVVFVTWAVAPQGVDSRLTMIWVPVIALAVFVCGIVDFWISRVAWRSATQGLK